MGKAILIMNILSWMKKEFQKEAKRCYSSPLQAWREQVRPEITCATWTCEKPVMDITCSHDWASCK
jgi:hypothetical protein